MNTLSKLTSGTALAFAVAFGATSPAAAYDTDPEPGILDLVSPNRLATMVANGVIAGVRTQMELQYEHLSTDILRGTVSISGITARPQLPYDQARQCEITIDRAMLSSDLTVPFESAAELTLDLIGARATLACLDRDIAVTLRTAGFADIRLDQARVRAGYVYATGETAIDATLAVNSFATLDFSGAGTLLPRLGDYGYPGDPAVRVSRAVVSLKDRGAWAALSGMLPPNLRDPEAVRQMGTEAVTQLLADGGLRPLSAVERNFVTQLMDRVQAFVADPGEITLEANLPQGGSVIEPEMLQSPSDLISALALEARTVPLARTRILDSATLAGLAAPDDLSDADRMVLALALIDGTGVPRAPSMVPDLVAALVDGNGPLAAEAAALTARALQDVDPARAYGYALTAAAADIGAAVPQLDRLEGRMTSAAVLAAQDAFLLRQGDADPLAAVTGDDPRDLRALTLASLTGAGAPRSYARAYYYVILAEAAGDIAATPLREEIEARFGARGDDVAALWRQTAARVQQQALADWVSADLAAGYRAQ